MTMSNRDKAVALVKAFETGSSSVLAYVNDETYIQHNLSFLDGKAAIVGFFNDKPSGVKIEVHRALEEGDLVAVHSTYSGVWNNNKPQVAFDVLRFESGLAVEHWDNLLELKGLNASGRSQVDGMTQICDKDRQVSNKQLVKELMDVAFVGGDYSTITHYISPEKYLQHNPDVADGLDGFNNFVGELVKKNIAMEYKQYHQIIADGNFVLVLSEGTFGDTPVAYYDLFRLENGLVVEHWDVVSEIPNRSSWQNDNGKF